MDLKNRLIVSYLIVILMPVVLLILVLDSLEPSALKSLPLLSSPISQAAIFSLIIVLTLLISIHTSNRFAVPITKIRHAMDRVGKGNLKTRLKLEGSNELLKLETAFNKMVGKLEASEIAKTEFLSITSHELRTPLTPIMANLELLQYEFLGPLNQQQKDNIHVILRNSKRLQVLISDILDVSRLQAGRMKFRIEKSSIMETIMRAIETVKVYANQKNISINVKDAQIPDIFFDRQRIQQVLINIIGNAIKFTPETGEIIIDVKISEDFITIMVTDSGIGIPAASITKIFKPFYQVDSSHARKHGGTGLGLAICKDIIDAHKGRIFAQSAPNEGTTFFVELPRRLPADPSLVRLQKLEKASQALALKGYVLTDKATKEKMLKDGFIKLNGDLRTDVDIKEIANKGYIISADQLFQRKVLGVKASTSAQYPPF